MKRYYILAAASLLFFSTIYFVTRQPARPLDNVLLQYRKDVQAVLTQVQNLEVVVSAEKPVDAIRRQFLASRESYKRVEWLAEYYNAFTARQINGPPVQEVEADEKNVIVEPEGFQVIEIFLYPRYEPASKKKLLVQINLLKSNLGRLEKESASLETTDAHIFDALRLQMFRVITLGISGFDSPLAENSTREALSSLAAIQSYVSLYTNSLDKKSVFIWTELNDRLQQAKEFLAVSKDFAAFDRAKFIFAYANPISTCLLRLQQELSIPTFNEPRALSASAPTLFSKNIFNASFFGPVTIDSSNAGRVLLGKKLFNDPIFSGNKKISCATCHRPDKAFTDGLQRSFAVNGKDRVKRNAPTLINVSLQAALFYDSRVAYLEDQANEVILSRDEMHGSFQEALKVIRNDTGYKRAFAEVFGRREIDEYNIKQAIASYLRSLVMLNSKFDRYMRGDEQAMNAIEVNGFNIFMGKGKCGTCHFMPLFNGTVPPGFNKTESEVIGVPATADTVHAVEDTDKGKFVVQQIPLYNHSFKTPGLRNVALTAPYMHNGVYSTLGEVIAFYDRGGGAGLGFKLVNLTLSPEKLNLSASEKRALIAFLQALTDESLVNHASLPHP